MPTLEERIAAIETEVRGAIDQQMTGHINGAIQAWIGGNQNRVNETVKAIIEDEITARIRQAFSEQGIYDIIDANVQSEVTELLASSDARGFRGRGPQ